MTLTILVLVLGAALFLFGGALLKSGDKKPADGAKFTKHLIKLIAVLLLVGSVCRLYVPYYLTSVNPAIIQEMVEGMQKKQNEDKNKAIRKYVRESAAEMIENAPVLGNKDAEKTIYVSGQLPIDPATGKFVEGGVAEQTHQSLKNVKAILNEAGYDFCDVVKTTVFLSDIADFAAMNEVYKQYYQSECPARSAFAVKSLPMGALVEIETIAGK